MAKNIGHKGFQNSYNDQNNEDNFKHQNLGEGRNRQSRESGGQRQQNYEGGAHRQQNYEDSGHRQQNYEGGRQQNYEGGRRQNYEGGRQQNYEGGRQHNYEGGRQQNYEGGRQQNYEGGGYRQQNYEGGGYRQQNYEAGGYSNQNSGWGKNRHQNSGYRPEKYEEGRPRYQRFDCFLVLDFEATCEEDTRIENPEIIEFPVLKVDSKSFEVMEEFHQYVKPRINPKLTDFCTKLTGITQETVDDSKEFPYVFEDLQNWMKEKVGLDKKFLFVTCGDWDLKEMLPSQCEREGIEVPDYMKTWMNIKRTYGNVTKNFENGMMGMIRGLNLKHTGKHHSGIDDCRNIANILRELSYSCTFRPTIENYDRESFKSSKNDSSNYSDRQSALKMSVQKPQLLLENYIPIYVEKKKKNKRRNTSEAIERDSKKIHPQENGKDEAPRNERLDVNNETPQNESGLLGVKDERPQKLKKGGKNENKGGKNENTQKKNQDVKEEKEPFDIKMLDELQDAFASGKFEGSRDVDEVQVLCAVGKYLHLIENTEERESVQLRIQVFCYVLSKGWKKAKKMFWSEANDADSTQTKTREKERKDDLTNKLNPGTEFVFPDHQNMINIIQKNSEEFRPRDKEELPPLLAGAKYVEKMGNEDRELVKNRIKLFYLLRTMDWKAAKKYMATAVTEASNIKNDSSSMDVEKKKKKKNVEMMECDTKKISKQNKIEKSQTENQDVKEETPPFENKMLNELQEALASGKVGVEGAPVLCAVGKYLDHMENAVDRESVESRIQTLWCSLNNVGKKPKKSKEEEILVPKDTEWTKRRDDLTSKLNQHTKIDFPDHQNVMKTIQDYLEVFKSKEREELPSLLAGGRCLEKMRSEDSELVENRIKLFYLAVFLDWKNAKKCMKLKPTNSTSKKALPGKDNLKEEC